MAKDTPQPPSASGYDPEAATATLDRPEGGEWTMRRPTDRQKPKDEDDEQLEHETE